MRINSDPQTTSRCPWSLRIWRINVINTKWKKLTKSYTERSAVLERFWKPIGAILSAMFATSAAYEFVESHGTLSIPVAGFLLLSVVVLLLVPISAIRVSVLRILAFVIDVVLLGVATFVILSLLRMGGGELNGPELIAVAWLWLWYFVLLDYRFRGTVGKRLFGLRLISDGNRLSFSASFIRVSLAVLSPIVLATLLSDALTPNASPFRYFAAMTVRQALLAFIPISILVFGGNQGIVDRFLGSEVVPPRKGARPTVLERRSKAWALLCLSSIAWGMLFAWLTYLAYGRLLFGASPKPAQSKFTTQYWQTNDPEAVARLWQTLPLGLRGRDPTKVLSNIKIIGIYPNPFTIETPASVQPLPYAKEFHELEQIQIIRISFHTGTSFLARMLVMQNLAELMASSAAQSEPRFFVVQIGTEEDFGIFFTHFYENSLLRVAGSDTSYSPLQPTVSLGVKTSLDRVRWLLLGDWNTLPP